MIPEAMKRLVLDEVRNVKDFTVGGKCSGCGMCCSNILPMSEKEIASIRKYIKKHNIKEQKTFAPYSTPVVSLCCPFLDVTKKCEKCKIYPVRPAVCRFFICRDYGGTKERFESLYGKKCLPIDVRKGFFG